MPPESIAVLVCIIAAFATFAVTLAYGEHQTRNLKRSVHAGDSGADAPRAREQELLKAA